MLPTTQFAYRKGLGTCEAVFSVSNTLHSVLESGHEARIVQIDFSAAYDRGIDFNLSEEFDSGLMVIHCGLSILESK